MSALLAPTTTPLPLPPADSALLTRLAARISCSTDEIVAFPSIAEARTSLSAAFFAGRRTLIARPGSDALGSTAWREARSAREADTQPLDGLVAASRGADTVILASPVDGGRKARPTISPRDLLLLRSRAPQPVLVLDLLEEDRARIPLTQPALLLPGTIVVRGFGRLWREAGAASIAPLVFVAGPRELVASLGAAPIEPALAARACADLDDPGIDTRVRLAAARMRLESEEPQARLGQPAVNP